MEGSRWLLIPAAFLLIAILPMPYGYYTLMRLVVMVSAIVVAAVAYASAGGIRWPTVVFGIVSLLFNPFVPVHLSRDIWFPIDLSVAALFAYFAFRRIPSLPSNIQE